MDSRIQQLVHYIAQVDPRAVNKLAYKYGYIAPKTEEGRKGLLFTGLLNEGESFLRSMAKYHPDRELILNADGPNIEPNVIDLSAAKPVTPATSVAEPQKNDTIKLVIIIIIAFVLYNVLKK